MARCVPIRLILRGGRGGLPGGRIGVKKGRIGVEIGLFLPFYGRNLGPEGRNWGFGPDIGLVGVEIGHFGPFRACLGGTLLGLEIAPIWRRWPPFLHVFAFFRPFYNGILHLLSCQYVLNKVLLLVVSYVFKVVCYFLWNLLSSGELFDLF